MRGGSRYEPATILATAGEPILLRFRRETFAASGGRVIFPALGKSIELPLFGEVALELLLEPGCYEFTCEQGLLRGVLEVDAVDLEHFNEARHRLGSEPSSARSDHNTLTFARRAASP